MCPVKYSWITVLGLAVTSFVKAQSYYVAPEGSDGNAGTSWAAPFLTIQKGIDSATAGQTVVVSNGTYVLTSQLLLVNGIKLQGFGGSAGTVIDANYSGRIMVISNSAAVVDGFTLKNGKITTSSYSGTGVRMYNGTMKNCTVCYCINTATQAKGIGVYVANGTIDNCVIENNDGYGSLGGYGNGGGGGVYMVSGLITNCVIQGNRGQNLGGGIRMDGGLVVGCTVFNNSAVSGNGGGLDPVGCGGGIYLSGGVVSNTLIATNVTTCFNNSSSRGGGIYISGMGTVVNCTVSGNSNQGIQPAAQGGGIYMTGGLVAGTMVTNNTQVSSYMTTWGVGAYVTGGGMMTNCTVVDNHTALGASSTCWGGGVYVVDGTLIECTIGTNSAGATASYGGGLYMSGATWVERCTIKRNYLAGASGSGGGVWSDGGIMRNCLIMGNRSPGNAGGLYVTAGTNENCTIVCNLANGNYGGVYWTNSPAMINDIVCNNSGGIENDIVPDLLNISYCCASSLTSGTGNVTNNPKFVDSGSGYGPGFIEGNYRLQWGSPCKDAGLTGGWRPSDVGLDHLPRIKGYRVDMGPYELQSIFGTYIVIR